MRIRHIAAQDNVDVQGFLIDLLLARHAIVLAGQIADLAGPIDPRAVHARLRDLWLRISESVE